MKFKQYENGSCDIEFSEEEIHIINQNKKIHLSDESLRHFGNMLVRIVSDWQLRFNEKTSNLTSFDDSIIKGE